MGEKCRLAEGRLAGAGDDVGRDAGQITEQRLVAAERQRDQRRAGLNDLVAEAAGQSVREIGGADLGDRRAAGGDDERRGGGGAVADGDAEAAVGMVDLADRMTERVGDAAGVAFGAEKVDDLAGRAVAEQLAERLFVPGDAVATDQGDEIGRRIAAERGLGEMWIGRKVAIGRGAEIGEVAAPAAGNQDLAARFLIVIDQQHAPTALAGDRGAHHPGAAGTEDDRVIGIERAQNLLSRGKPVGGMRPAAPRAVRQGFMSLSVRVRPVSPPIAQLSPSAKVKVIASASPPSR